MPTREEDIALIDTYLAGGLSKAPTVELQEEEDIAPPPPTSSMETEELKEDLQVEQKLTKQRLQDEKAQAAEEKRHSKAMEALDRQVARKEERELRIKTKAAQQAVPVAVEAVKDVVSGPVDAVKETAGDVGAVMERVSTPGSILLPVAIVILLFLAVIPVNGYPRFAWLWLVITGNAQLAQITVNDDTGSGVTGDISDATPQTPEQQSWAQQRKVVEHYHYTGIEEFD